MSRLKNLAAEPGWGNAGTNRFHRLQTGVREAHSEWGLRVPAFANLLGGQATYITRSDAPTQYLLSIGFLARLVVYKYGVYARSHLCDCWAILKSSTRRMRPQERGNDRNKHRYPCFQTWSHASALHHYIVNAPNLTASTCTFKLLKDESRPLDVSG
ncbi:hypothetical protein SODALDRAFT_198580 [Sodiomyces alkalinus F11]|uniref:Uncharacterized protein n=1 Tax=Sodiomyces alkalinus (strain CBS 110278 / VKM F-3762 / F11) TaxID=1314773 RepID=A0A3N2PSL4_SODAK|nr:hypothetical protein SODALDRAFT_198580 [Sodiomyces alkalinus F11]ROT37497.1 hypothetical protein SODALDRAFT_198580 [Sodiomyces alkalinus F11]